AQALAGAGLRDNAIGARRADQLCREAAEALTSLEPELPGAVQVAVPRVHRAAQVFGHAVRRSAERMIGEIDLIALEHPGEARPDVLLQPAFIQGACGHRSV